MKLYNILHSTLLEGGRARGRSGVGKKEKEENKLLEKALDNYMQLKSRRGTGCKIAWQKSRNCR
jgi:hypothetical protein